MFPTPALPPPRAVSWTPTERVLPAFVTDGRPETYEILRQTAHQDPADFGLVWDQPVTVGKLVVRFASLGGRSFEPDPRAARVEVWEGSRWRPVVADLEIDTTRVGELAPAQMRGSVQWTYRFHPRTTPRIRLYCPAPAHRDLGYQCIAVADLTASPDGATDPRGTLHRVGPSLEPPACLKTGGNLAVKEAGATVTPGNPWRVSWIRPMMVSRVRVPKGVHVHQVAWAAYGGSSQVEALEQRADGWLTFSPVCVDGLIIHADRRLGSNVVVACGPEVADYYEAVRLSRTDMLGQRFRAAPRQDFATMATLLQPIDFTKAAIGRPADMIETMVTWTGTFFQVLTAPCQDPSTGAQLPAQALDRWFAPLPDGKPPDWFRTTSSCLDGWLPAVVTRYELEGVRVTQTVFVTAPDAPIYGTVSMVTFQNTSSRLRRLPFRMAMGLRRIYGTPVTPFLSDPLVTGYRLDADDRTVRDGNGEIVLHAFQRGRFGGTTREPHICNDVLLQPGQEATLAYFVPDVTSPMSDAAAIAQSDPKALLRSFRQYWRRFLGPVADLTLPEPGLADALRNLLVQCAVIGLDGDAARYGAYHYETYFGLEEGWTAVALAQFGLGEYARRVMDYMLSDSALDKGNYHHQYRNGLAAWYAADVARLCPNANWLRSIAPALRRCADWTIQQIEANKDPKWGGILPRHVYGGDIGMPAYSFYANAACWRGLNDTAVLMGMLGDTEAAARYREAADRYRKRLTELADTLVDRSTGLPFLPMSFGLQAEAREKEPPYAVLAADVPASDTWSYLANYWNLFAPCFQELRLFPVSDDRARWVPRYMQERGGVLAGQVRFANALDGVYGKGYMQALLDAGEREEFVTSLMGLFAVAMSRNLWSNPEVSGVFPLRTDNLRTWWEYARERWFWIYRYGGAWAQGWQNQEGEPLAAGAGMAVQLLRMALVREDYADDPPRDLRLLDGVPKPWFEAGSRIVCGGMRTFFGTLSIEATATATGMTVRIQPDGACSARRVLLRACGPDGRPPRVATANGTRLTTEGEMVVIGPLSGITTVDVRW